MRIGRGGIGQPQWTAEENIIGTATDAGANVMTGMDMATRMVMAMGTGMDTRSMAGKMARRGMATGTGIGMRSMAMGTGMGMRSMAGKMARAGMAMEIGMDTAKAMDTAIVMNTKRSRVMHSGANRIMGMDRAMGVTTNVSAERNADMGINAARMAAAMCPPGKSSIEKRRTRYGKVY